MKIAAIIEYLQDAEVVDRHRPRHREYLATLKASGQLVASGPFMDHSGALLIYDAESVEAAEAILKADPFHDTGVFLSWRLRPWNVVSATLNV